MGIKIDRVVLQDADPPDPVKPSYNGVNEAEQQRETLINQSQITTELFLVLVKLNKRFNKNKVV